MNTNNALPADGTITLKSIESIYRIDKVLGAGGFGITYHAVGSVIVGNITTAAPFAIKEYFPADYCRREGRRVVASTGHEAEFIKGKDDFIREAQRLHDIGTGNANIVKVNEVFEANGTAYYIMEYINGQSLTSLVTGNGVRRLRYEEALSLLEPIMDAVDFLHRNGTNHLDIKPDNIMIRSDVDGNLVPVLIDFGQSLHFKKSGGATSPKGVAGVSEGYSPMEQYAGIRHFAPEADIYALTATLYFALTGKAPAAAAELNSEKIGQALGTVVPREYMDAFRKGLAKLSEERVSSISVLKGLLGMTGGGHAGGGRDTDVIGKEKHTDINTIAAEWGKPAAGALIGAAIVAAVVIIMNGVHNCGGSVPTADTVLIQKDSLFTDSIESVQGEDGNAELPPTGPASAGTTQSTSSTQQGNTSTTSSSSQSTSSSGTSASSSTSVTTTSRINLGYAVWQGQVSGGKPNGKGTMTFSQAHRVPTAGGDDIEADAGDYVSGYASNGKIEQGVLYDSYGNKKVSIIY